MSNLNCAYYFDIIKDENSVINVGNIEEIPLIDGLYPDGLHRGKIQAMEFEDIPGRFRFVSRFYEQLHYFRYGVVTALIDLPSKLGEKV